MIPHLAGEAAPELVDMWVAALSWPDGLTTAAQARLRMIMP